MRLARFFRRWVLPTARLSECRPEIKDPDVFRPRTTFRVYGRKWNYIFQQCIWCANRWRLFHNGSSVGRESVWSNIKPKARNSNLHRNIVFFRNRLKSLQKICSQCISMVIPTKGYEDSRKTVRSKRDILIADVSRDRRTVIMEASVDFTGLFTWFD